MTADLAGPAAWRAPRAGRPSAAFRFGLAVVLLAAAVALFGPSLVPGDPLAQTLELRNAPPSLAHPLGLDALGRDMLARLAAGARLSLGIALAGTALALALGAGLGLVGAALGGPAAWIAIGAVDLVRAMPGILLALVLMVALGMGAGSVVIALGIAYAPTFALVARASYERETAAGYVAAARVLGAGPLATLRRHILPNLAGALVTQVALVVPRAVTTESVLSFLGLGVVPETPTWGRMIADGMPFIEAAPHGALFPVLALSLATVGCVLVGDRVRAVSDPLREIVGGGR